MLIKFSSSTCQPCKQLDKMLKELGATYSDMQINKDSKLAESFGIRSVPVLVKVDDKLTEVARITGLPSMDELKEFIGNN